MSQSGTLFTASLLFLAVIQTNSSSSWRQYHGIRWRFPSHASGIKDVNKIGAGGCDPPTSGGKPLFVVSYWKLFASFCAIV